MIEKQLFSITNEQAKQLTTEIREVKQLLGEISEKLSRIETGVQRVFTSDFPNNSKFETLSNLSITEEDIIAMANDPEIQAELAAINREFAVAEMPI
ncbi:hypothetical protein [Aerosakkonema funiforme]|uniref:Uncharacterized protein n=1 Tax=Aerosakkonema funiforme FACHB-1375 TaxID=2949571 RepID=A0A926VCF4_9CYAN|nr:hypothetical protein [Aerosakkonema funiforme]MBD2181291.1 hypothetical protein [Aerosakkonema funiforme FACHB-1375]